MIYNSINNLVNYAIDCELIGKEDKIYAINRILEILGLSEYEQPSDATPKSLEETLKELCDYAVDNGIIEDSILYRDLFDTKLMGVLTPMPSQVIKKFNELYAQSPEKATDFYYKFSCDTDYIRRYRIAKDVKWKTETEYGMLDIKAREGSEGNCGC